MRRTCIPCCTKPAFNSSGAKWAMGRPTWAVAGCCKGTSMDRDLYTIWSEYILILDIWYMVSEMIVLLFSTPNETTVVAQVMNINIYENQWWLFVLELRQLSPASLRRPMKLQCVPWAPWLHNGSVVYYQTIRFIDGVYDYDIEWHATSDWLRDIQAALLHGTVISVQSRFLLVMFGTLQFANCKGWRLWLLPWSSISLESFWTDILKLISYRHMVILGILGMAWAA